MFKMITKNFIIIINICFYMNKGKIHLVNKLIHLGRSNTNKLNEDKIILKELIEM